MNNVDSRLVSFTVLKQRNARLTRNTAYVTQFLMLELCNLLTFAKGSHCIFSFDGC